MAAHDDVLSELLKLRRHFDPVVGDRLSSVEASVRRKDWPGALASIRLALESVLLRVAEQMARPPDLKGKALPAILAAIEERLTVPAGVARQIRQVAERNDEAALADLPAEVGSGLEALRQVMVWAGSFVDAPSRLARLRASKKPLIAAAAALVVVLGGAAFALSSGGKRDADPSESEDRNVAVEAEARADAAPAPVRAAPAAADREAEPAKAEARVDPTELREAVALRADDANAAADALLGLLQRHPNDGDVLYELGQTYRKLGNKDEAFIFNSRACKAGNERACRTGRPPAPLPRR